MTTEIVRAGLDKAMKDVGLESIRNEVMEVERVFIAWMGDRSKPAAKIAEEAAVDVKLVRKLLRSGEFQERYLRETEGFRKIAQEYTRGRVHEVMDAVVDRMTELVEEGEARDAIGAARVLASMIAEPATKVENQTNNIDARVLQLAGQGIKSVDDLKRIMSASLDGNISKVEEVRATKAK